MHSCFAIADIAVPLKITVCFRISLIKLNLKMFCHFVWICGEIYTSRKNTCLFPMDISTRLLHVYFRYMSLNVVNYRSCYSSSNVPIRTPLSFQKVCNSFFYLHFLMNKIIYTIYHILNCMMGLILEKH